VISPGATLTPLPFGGGQPPEISNGRPGGQHRLLAVERGECGRLAVRLCLPDE
jgi:hypothetical protein